LSDDLEAIRSDIQKLAGTVSNIAQDSAIEAANAAHEKIRQNSLSALAIAFAVGFFYGVFARR